MKASYRDFAYKEIIERKDRGAGLAASFRFLINADDVYALSKPVPSRKNPSFRCIASEIVDPKRCLLLIAELKTGEAFGATTTTGEIQAKGMTHRLHNIEKHLTAIFSTAGYLCAEFQRDASLVIQSAERQQRTLMDARIKPTLFSQEPDNIVNQSIGFYATMLIEASKKAGIKDLDIERPRTSFIFDVNIVPASAMLN